MHYLVLTFFMLFQVVGISQNSLNPVVWKATYVDTSNTEGEITLTATIQDKWHIYSQRPTDAGPIPTSFILNPDAAHYQLIGHMQEINPHEEYVKAFEAKVFVFEHEAVFKQHIKRKNGQAFTIKVSVEYMTCNDMQCLPPKIVDVLVQVPAITSTSR